jgi:hypothetical protein
VIPEAEEIGNGAFRYTPSYQSKRVDARDGAYAWYELAGNVVDSTGKKGAYPWDPSYPTADRTFTAGSNQRSDDGSVDELIITSVAGTNDGAFNGTLTVAADHLGRDAEALTFNGVDNFIELPHNPLAGGSSDFTITVFLKPGGSLMGLNPAIWSGRYGIVGSEEAPSLVMVGNDLEYSVRLPNGDGSTVPTFVRHEGVIADLFTEVRWYYIAFRKSGSDYQIWVDGLTDGQKSTTDDDTTFGPDGRRTVTTDATNQDAYTMALSSAAYLTNMQYWIGRVGSSRFEGSISDVAFFNEALSAAQIMHFEPSWEIQLSNTAKTWYCEAGDGEDLGTFNVGSPTACKQECSTAHAGRTGHTCNDVGYDSVGTADSAGTTLGAVNVNSDIAVADGTYLRARIRLLDMYDERQWQAQFGESKPEQVICSPPFEVDLSSPITGWVAAGTCVGAFFVATQHCIGARPTGPAPTRDHASCFAQQNSWETTLGLNAEGQFAGPIPDIADRGHCVNSPGTSGSATSCYIEACVTDLQEVAVAGWTPVSDYSPYQDKLDTRWTAITDEHSQIKTLEMQLLQQRSGLSDEVLVAYHTVQENATWIVHSVHGAVTATTAGLEYQLQGIDLPRAALVVGDTISRDR